MLVEIERGIEQRQWHLIPHQGAPASCGKQTPGFMNRLSS